jgi:hypothetical protein
MILERKVVAVLSLKTSPPLRRESLFTFKVGGREIPVITVRNCRTCRSRYRRRVESLLVEGKPPSAIVELLPSDCGLNRRNVREHLKRGHLPIHQEVGRRLLGERAVTYGAEIAAQVDALISMKAIAAEVMRRSHESVLGGELEPTVTQGLRAAKLHHDLGEERRELLRWRALATDNAAAAAHLVALSQQFMSPKNWSTFLKAVEDAGYLAFVPAREGRR